MTNIEPEDDNIEEIGAAFASGLLIGATLVGACWLLVTLVTHL